MQGLTKKIISALEDEQIPFSNYLLSFIFIVFIRHFFENFSQIINKFNNQSALIVRDMIHFALSYMMLAILLTFLFHVATNNSIQKIMRVVLPGFIALWLNPLIDIFFSPKPGVVLLYLQPGFVNDLVYSYFTFFGDFFGVSLGLKCEVFIVLIGVYLYLRAKNLNIFLSLFYVWATYSIIFFWGSLPYIAKFIQNLFGFPYSFSGEMMIHLYLVSNLFLGILLVYLANPQLIRIIVKDMSVLRILHYELMLLFGVSLAFANSSYTIWQQLYFSNEIIINIFLSMVSLLFACLYIIVINNISDIEIDKISNQNRPLVKNEIDIKTYNQLGYCFLIISLFYAAMINGKAFLINAVFIGAYYLYSTLPLRLKRVTLFSKLVISFNSIALILLGYILVTQAVYDFPEVLFYIYFLGVTVSANFIDLKDVKGDRAAGIITLPVLLGEKTAKIIIGIGFWVTYISFFYLIKNEYFLILLIAGGGIQFYLINKMPYREFPVLAFYNVSISLLIAYLLLSKVLHF